MPQLARHLILIVAVSSTLLLTNLGGARLWDRDEPRNAGCAAEMIERGDWVTPVFNGELRIHKPVLLYWFMMTAYGVFGVNEFSARLWSALLGIGTVLQTYAIGRRLFHPRAAFWASIILSTAVMFDVAGRAATPDSVFMFFTTLSATIYVLATFRPREETLDTEVTAPQLRVPGQWFPQRWPVVAAMYAAMGVAILAKGPVGLVLPTAVIGMFLLIVRLPAPLAEVRLPAWLPGSTWLNRTGWGHWLVGLVRPFAPGHFLRTCWIMRPLTALCVALLVALPWYIWVGLRTQGDFIEGFLLEHNLGRTLRPMEGHSGPIFYYPAAIMLGFFPWSIFLVSLLVETGRRIRQAQPWTTGYLLAACWVGVYVGLFSIARTKLPSYVTPCYPGLALLAGCFLFHWSRGESLVSRRWQIVNLSLLAVTGAAILIAVPLVATVFLPGERWLPVLGLVPLVGALLCLRAVLRSRHTVAVTTLAATAFAFSWTLFGWCTVQVDQHRATDRLMAALPADTPLELGSLGCLEPSWVFYSGRTIHELRLPRPDHDSPARQRSRAAAAPLESNGRVPVKRPQVQVDDFLAGGPNRYVITTDRVVSRWGGLPGDVTVLAEAPYFLKQEKLLLLVRKEAADVPPRDGVPAVADRSLSTPRSASRPNSDQRPTAPR